MVFLSTATKKLAPENWPSKGAIKLENVSLTYTKDAPPALNDVSLDIHPSEKVTALPYFIFGYLIGTNFCTQCTV